MEPPIMEPSLSELSALWYRAEDLVRAGYCVERSTKDPQALINAQRFAITRLQEAWNAKDSSHVTVWLDACARLKASEATPIVIELLQAGGPWTNERLAAADAARSVTSKPEDRTRVAGLLYKFAPEIRRVHIHHGARALLGAVLLDEMLPAFEQCLPLFEQEPLCLLGMSANALCGHLEHATGEERQTIPQLDRWEAALAQLRKNHRHASDVKQMDETHTDYLDILLLRVLLEPSKERFLPILLEDCKHEHLVIKVAAARATKIILREDPSPRETISQTPGGSELLEGADFVPFQTYYYKPR